MIPDDDRAAFLAEVCDVKTVRSLKLVRVTVELDIAHHARVAQIAAPGSLVTVFRHEEPVSAAVAPVPSRTAAAAERSAPEFLPGLSAEKLRPRKGTLAWQAVKCCKDPIFWAFLRERSGNDLIKDEDDARAQVLMECDIESRGELNSNPRAAEEWREIESKFTAWKMVDA